MPNYRRLYSPGGTFFFTQVTYDRLPFLCTPPARPLLRHAIEACRARHPFVIHAFVLLPEHLHTIWTLPDGDADFSIRWNLIKRSFTMAWLSSRGAEGVVSLSRTLNRRRGVWQRRFWEHAIRNQEDLNRHLDYIHYNPVKHGHAACPHAWGHSSFHQSVKNELYAPNWCCACEGVPAQPPDFTALDQTAIEYP